MELYLEGMDSAASEFLQAYEVASRESGSEPGLLGTGSRRPTL